MHRSVQMQCDVLCQGRCRCQLAWQTFSIVLMKKLMSPLCMHAQLQDKTCSIHIIINHVF